MTIEIGQVVKLKQPLIQGEVIDIQYDKDSKSLAMLVEFDEDGDGITQQRWFPEPKLEVVA